MRTAFFIGLLVSGLSAQTTTVIREFHFVDAQKKWSNARRYCREKFTELATIENQHDNDHLLSLAQASGAHLWIGLQDNRTQWWWSLDNKIFNTQTHFSNLPSKFSSVEKSVHLCTVMTQTGGWHVRKCEDMHPSVCYYDGTDSAKYILVTNKKTWRQAQDNCRSKYTDLVTVTNTSENDVIRKLLLKDSWIGLHRNTWEYWNDKTLSVFTNWEKTRSKDNPTHRSCGALNTMTGKWQEYFCSKTFYFICQKDSIQPRSKTTLKLKFQSGVNLNDPAVQDQMLKTMHGNLNKYGLPDLKLRWTQTNGQIIHKEPKKKNQGSCG